MHITAEHMTMFFIASLGIRTFCTFIKYNRLSGSPPPRCYSVVIVFIVMPMHSSYGPLLIDISLCLIKG